MQAGSTMQNVMLNSPTAAGSHQAFQAATLANQQKQLLMPPRNSPTSSQNPRAPMQLTSNMPRAIGGHITMQTVSAVGGVANVGIPGVNLTMPSSLGMPTSMAGMGMMSPRANTIRSNPGVGIASMGGSGAPMGYRPPGLSPRAPSSVTGYVAAGAAATNHIAQRQPGNPLVHGGHLANSGGHLGSVAHVGSAGQVASSAHLGASLAGGTTAAGGTLGGSHLVASGHAGAQSIAPVGINPHHLAANTQISAGRHQSLALTVGSSTQLIGQPLLTGQLQSTTSPNNVNGNTHLQQQMQSSVSMVKMQMANQSQVPKTM